MNEEEKVQEELNDQLEGAEAIKGIETSTSHDHFYESGGINENNLLDVICYSCGHGMQVDKHTTIVEGKLISLGV